MNAHLELYRRGGGLIVRTIYCKGGRRAFVLHEHRRAWEAAAALAREGKADAEIAHTLGRTVAFVRRVRRWRLRENSWK